MKDKYLCRQTLFVINQLAIVTYFVFLARNNTELPHNISIQLGIITLLVFDACYISYKNIRNNKTLSKFSLLLVVTSWYFLFGLSFDVYPISEICKVLLSLILFQSLSFSLTFLFQGGQYKYRNAISIAMGTCCGVTLVFKFISENFFNFFLLTQFVLTFFSVLIVVLIHKKRMVFLVKSQRIQIFISFTCAFLPFAFYSLYFLSHASLVESMGTYMICMLCFATVHNIIFCAREKEERHLPLVWFPKTVLVVLGLFSAAFFGLLFELPVVAIFILIYVSSAIMQMHNIFMYLQICKNLKSDDCHHQDFYTYSLSAIRSEKALKREVTNFLHDDVLQDLLSVKMLVRKSEKPDVRQLMLTALEELTHKVRFRMEHYHSVESKSLTLRENYKNLVESTRKAFPLSNAEIAFMCQNDVFLIDPYTKVIYRIVKELITNSLKHSEAKSITINLSLERNVITLAVLDDGIGFELENLDRRLCKGLGSVCDTVYSLGGAVDINSKVRRGTEITVTIPMKGERSYESFISR